MIDGESVLASNRLWGNNCVIRKQRWFYVRTGDGQWWNKKDNRWVPRFITIEVNLEQDAPRDEREGYLRIYRNEEDKAVLKEIPLRQLSSVDKKFLKENEARRFPIRSPNGSPKVYLDEKEITEDGPEPECEEFRWGHVIFTLSGSGLYGEFCCGTTKVRDEWKEWFEDYLILQETEKMGKEVFSQLKVPKPIDMKHVRDYTKTFLTHQFTGDDDREVITPCCTIDKQTTPTKEVLWWSEHDDVEKPTSRRVKALIKPQPEGTKLHVYGKMLGMKSVDKLTLSLNEYEFIVAKQWSNTLSITHTTSPLAYTLIADNVEQRDSWLRWLQYVKAIPSVDRDLAEMAVWREATLVLSGSPKGKNKPTNGKLDDKKNKCYCSVTTQKLAFREFPSCIVWESAVDETGRTVYKDSLEGKIRTRDTQLGHAMCADVAYDLYEEYFQPKQVTYPMVTQTAEGEDREGEGVGLWKKLRNKTKVLLSVSGATDVVRSRTRKRLDVENTEVDYKSDQVEKREFLAPWDVYEEEPPEIHVDPPETDPEMDSPSEQEPDPVPVGEPMTIAQAKKKFGDEWKTMTPEHRRRILMGSGGMSEAQAQKEVFALPYSVINNAKDIVGLTTWTRMSYKRQLEECNKYKHLAGPDTGLKIFGKLPGKDEVPKPKPKPAPKLAAKRSFAAKQALMNGLRTGALNKAVEKMEESLNDEEQPKATGERRDTAPQKALAPLVPLIVLPGSPRPPPSPSLSASPGSPLSPKRRAGCSRHGDFFVFATNKTGISWEGEEKEVWVKTVTPGSVAHELGVTPGMVLTDVDGTPIKSKEDLQAAREGVKKKGKGTFRLIEQSIEQAVPAPQTMPAAVPSPSSLLPFYPVDITSPTILQAAVPYVPSLSVPSSPISPSGVSHSPLSATPVMSGVVPLYPLASSVRSVLSLPSTSLSPSPVVPSPLPQSPVWFSQPSINILSKASTTPATASPSCSPLPVSNGTLFKTAPKMWCYVRERSGERVKNKKRWCVGSDPEETITVSKLDNGVLKTVEVIGLRGCSVKNDGGLGMTLMGQQGETWEFELQSTPDRDSWTTWFSTVMSMRVGSVSSSASPLSGSTQLSLGYPTPSAVSFSPPVLRKPNITPPRGAAP
eukprot:TRINITY_DN22140_c0_g1_i1.p1 TRINITY_DN22140_c0_g1~~TRINITY_DN22140_c0_g1_i1.p1  ORF type:complete len:1123 (+),score=269.26 TRINITY_DN22140_c0_g1_i1:89-3457(+)